MSTVVVCCETLKDEMALAVERTGCDLPFLWLKSGLHNSPEVLREKLQEVLDGIEGYRRVLLGFGFCGNALAGLCTKDFEMIIPRADDCITILLGSVAVRQSHERCYFLTKGWLDGERNIYQEYLYSVEKYGLEMGKKIGKMLLGSYHNLAVLDTGAFPLDALCEQTRPIAKELELEHLVIPASIEFLEALLAGPWPRERFLTIPPHTEIDSRQLEPA